MKRPNPKGFSIVPVNGDIVIYYDLTDNAWRDNEVWPYEHCESMFSARSTGINYGDSVIEGLKFYLNKQETHAIILHLEENAQRFANSAIGMNMPGLPTNKFDRAIRACVKLNSEFIPGYKNGALYIRPIQAGCAKLGLRGGNNYKCVFWCSPVGMYNSASPDCFVTQITRATSGGTGRFKTARNYSIARMALIDALENHGCQEVIFGSSLFALSTNSIQEFSVMSSFCVKNGILYTPPLDRGTILPSLTRKTVIDIARVLGIEVKERELSILDMIDSDGVFGTGTAAEISIIRGFKFPNGNYRLINNGKVDKMIHRLSKVLSALVVDEIPEDERCNGLEELKRELVTKVTI